MLLRGPIDLPGTLHGGQAFRWRRDGDAHVGLVGGRPVRLSPAGASVRVEGSVPRADAARCLGLARADEARRLRLARDPALARDAEALAGLRILRQDPWEATAAFIASANNHLLRIGRSLAALAERWGEPVDSPWGELRAFPRPEALARATEAQLVAAGLGYRAPYLKASARMVALGDVDLRALRGASPDEAREALLALPGVGPKVADCIALFSLDVPGAFPVDRWVVRAMGDRFFGGAAPRPAEAVAFARARWGDDAGLAQQWIFHAARVAAQAPGTREIAPRPRTPHPPGGATIAGKTRPRPH